MVYAVCLRRNPRPTPVLLSLKAFGGVAGAPMGRAVTRFAGETVNSGIAEGRVKRLSTRMKSAIQLMLRPSFGSSALELATCDPWRRGSY